MPPQYEMVWKRLRLFRRGPCPGFRPWASDFRTVTTATLPAYYIVFFLEAGTRRIVHWNTSSSADEE